MIYEELVKNKVFAVVAILLLGAGCASVDNRVVDCHQVPKKAALEYQEKHYKGGLMLCVGSPMYPAVAVRERIQGYAVVVFDVLPNGNTHNIRVIEASPKNMFESSAATAMTKTKFQYSESGFKDLIYKYTFKP
ncbi:MAG: TonB family protein [Cellvibrionaceae bacterium]